MKIFLDQKSLKCLSDNNIQVFYLDIGIDHLDILDTHLIDNIVSDVLPFISDSEEVFLFSKEALIIKMLGRKIEDKIKKEVHYNKILS
jgi:hypothetical protein